MARDALSRGKRCPFARQETPFYKAKGHVSASRCKPGRCAAVARRGASPRLPGAKHTAQVEIFEQKTRFFDYSTFSAGKCFTCNENSSIFAAENLRRGSPPRHDKTEDISLITYLNEAAARHGQPVKAGRTVKAARQPLKAVELLTVLSKVTAGDGTGRMSIDEKNVGM